MKTALYARYSSDNQRDESIDAQVRAINEYATKSEITVSVFILMKPDPQHQTIDLTF